MKKFIVLSLVGLLVIAFGTMAFAQAKKPEPPKLDFRASGFIDAASIYYRNVSPTTAGIFGPPGAAFQPGGAQFDKVNSGMSTRAHLKFDAVYGKETSGTIFFEMDSTRWGDTGGSGFTGGKAGKWGGDEVAVEIKNLFFDFAVPAYGLPFPQTVRVGLHPLSIRPRVFVYTDGTGVTLSTKIDPATISLYWFKALEGKDASADDVDVYGLHASAKVDKFTVGGYGLYYNMNTYPVSSATTLLYGVSPSNKADFWWLGAYADGKAGPVNLNFDFVYSYGEVERRGAYPARPDVKYRGWSSRLAVDYPWEKFNFGFVGRYATGADMKKTSATGIPGTTDAYGLGTSSKKVGSYVVPPFSEQFAIAGDSVIVSTEWVRALTRMAPFSTTDVYRGAWGGLWMAQAYGSFKATPWYKVTLRGMYVGDTTKHGNTIGNARSAGRPRDDKSVGWEIDLINEINIYRNLKWDIAFGYLFAGDALDYNVSGNVNKSPKDPYALTTRLVFSF
ncbi:MAG: hypothetical protein KGZ49_09605 [Syntrophaceae bacterium]|nr:hypothetical protein [Syntrophaceae bacterium]